MDDESAIEGTGREDGRRGWTNRRLARAEGWQRDAYDRGYASGRAKYLDAEANLKIEVERHRYDNAVLIAIPDGGTVTIDILNGSPRIEIRPEISKQIHRSEVRGVYVLHFHPKVSQKARRRADAQKAPPPDAETD